MALESRPQAKDQKRRYQVVALVLAGAFAPLFVTACAQKGAKTEEDIRALDKENNAKNLVERARAFAFVGDFTRAEEYYSSALEAGADPREVLPPLMDVCVRTGRYRSAIQHGENQLRNHPGDVRTRLMVGALYVGLNEPDQAKAHLEAVIDKPMPPPEMLHGEAHYFLAVAAKEENDAVGADRHFREYLRIEPTGSHVDEARGSLLKQVVPQTMVTTGSGAAPQEKSISAPAVDLTPQSSNVDGGAKP